jgi:hypothetical protein
MEQECKQCKHFFETKFAFTGECRRFPPVVAPGGFNTAVFPDVPIECWCGEFISRVARPETPKPEVFKQGRNKGMHRNNTSGITGVSWHKRKNKWMAHVTLDGKLKYLGSYDDKEEAGTAVREFRAKHRFSSRHGMPTEGNP